jgi:DNA-binding transcriptional LysR family regulator
MLKRSNGGMPLPAQASAALWAAVTAGLGVTLRTAEGVPPHLRVLDPAISGLPALGGIELALHRSGSEQSPAIAQLQTLLIEAVTAG